MKFVLNTIFIICAVLCIYGCSTGSKIITPGNTDGNKILLSNGWKLSPAGKQADIGDLPLNIAISPDGNYAISTNNGQSNTTLSVVKLNSLETVQTVNISNSWLGIKFSGDGRKLYVSGGSDNVVFIYGFSQGKLNLTDSVVIAPKWPKSKIWLGGLDIDEARGELYITGKQSAEFFTVDIQTKKVISSLKLPSQPYTCLSSVKNNYVYISLWGGDAVALLNKETGKVEKTIPAGNHPNDILESADGKYLYVANGNQNSVSVIDIKMEKEIEKLNSALLPAAAPGSTPNALALSSNGTKLYIANADNNCLAVMDVSEPGRSHSLGFIPTGWYPTSVKVVPGKNIILVANGKGGRSFANPHGPNPTVKGEETEFIGKMLKGTLSLIEEPAEAQLAEYSKQVYENCPLTQKAGSLRIDRSNPIPADSGVVSPIKHVFYIVKENRTYDQVLGDMEEGNGDPALCLFPEKVTPNIHALAREFVLLDNFYCDAEVSADGHNWSMGAYATDYVEKSWPAYYGGRGGVYEYEGGYPIAYPYNGYMWDNCKRNNVTYRSYGEFVHNGKTMMDSSKAAMESLEGHVAPFYRGWDLGYSDVERVKDWMKEFDEYEKNGELPQFQVIRLPNDHTSGTASGKLTPLAYAAQNDLALGMLVERISHSKYWENSAIFVVEDDAQNGPDHVDAHRSEALVISPYTKHKFVDHSMYSTSSMLRTMELILRLPPMSQYDAAAVPMFNSFSGKPDLSTYKLRPANIDLNEKNQPGSFGQLRSSQMDLSREDATPEIEFNEVIWKSVFGEASQMPAPVRSAFAKYTERED
ncbi:MAG: alkaline phosphatase family protein [Ignavibacteriales bacterium]